jgi:hypothetical protein
MNSVCRQPPPNRSWFRRIKRTRFAEAPNLSRWELRCGLLALILVSAAITACIGRPTVVQGGFDPLAREATGVDGTDVLGGWQKVIDFSSRIELPGVSVLPPHGPDWIMGRLQKGPHLYIQFVKLDQFRQTVEHLIGAGLHSEVLLEWWPSSYPLGLKLHALSYRFETAGARPGEADVFDGAPYMVNGTTCYRYRALANGLATPSSTGMRLTRHVRGVTCIHPNAYRVIRLRIFQQLPARMEPLSIDSEISPFYDSLKLTPLAG